MEINIKLRDQIFEIIENQIRDNDPPETKLTFEKLRKEGNSKFVAKQLIGQCVAVELFRIMKFQEPFNEERYIKNLLNLPKEPKEL
ncbi:MAG: hypothetical protein KAX05_00620 [Bacteroidales bacterium]|nr:hypothetical protein [Bacteroidales bacterium]